MPERFKSNTMIFHSFRIFVHRRHVGKTTLACVALSGALALTGAARGGQQKVRRPARPNSTVKSAPPVTKPAPPAAVPFRAGEKLVFRVLWSKYSVNAGNLELSAVEQRTFFVHLAWHFRAVAHSMDTIRILYALDDQFDSYTDATLLTSLQYEMYLHEQGKQQNGAWRMTGPGDPAPANVTAARVPPGTRDPIGLLYGLRAADWKSTPEIHMPAFDGHNLYEVVARAESSGPVTVPAGQFTASRISVAIMEHGEPVSGTHFVVWLAQDTARTPLLIEAEIPFGAARVELMSLP
jgi:hypothetical protein